MGIPLVNLLCANCIAIGKHTFFEEVAYRALYSEEKHLFFREGIYPFALGCIMWVKVFVLGIIIMLGVKSAN